jgi:hypothetical protein
LYSRYENDATNPDFIVGNDFARVGVVKNPTTTSGSILQQSRASALTPIYQTIGVGSTAVGYVASWDSSTGVLKVYNPVGLASTSYGFRMVDFTSQIGAGGSYAVQGQTSGAVLGIDTSFGTVSSPGTATTVGNALVQLGQNYVQGVAAPEVKKYSGEILYIDNRAAIQRSATQKEDIKIVLEF